MLKNFIKSPNPNAKIAPGPAGTPILGNIPDQVRQGMLNFYVNVWETYGDVARMQTGPVVMHQIIHPDHVHYVLVQNRDNYTKGLSHEKMRLFLGNGLLTSNGTFWKRQRRLMQPKYTPRGIAQFADIMVSATQQLVAEWTTFPAGHTFDMNEEMLRLTMSIISRAMFNVDISESFSEASDMLSFMLRFVSERSLAIIDPPLFIPTPLNKQYKHALKVLDDFIYGIIKERRQQPAGNDLLSILMTATDADTGEIMTDEQLRDEVLITFFAGHETTAQTLTWAWYLLSHYPEIEQKLHAELDEVLGDRPPTLDDISRLPYTRMIIDETLRLYPPVALTARDVVEDDEIEGYAIPAGSMVIITPYITHRHPHYWQTPHAFNPDHFTPEQTAERPRYAYYPFGAGARICIGNHFALMEAVLTIAEIARQHTLRLSPRDRQVEPEFMGTLTPGREVLMMLQKR